MSIKAVAILAAAILACGHIAAVTARAGLPKYAIGIVLTGAAGYACLVAELYVAGLLALAACGALTLTSRSVMKARRLGPFNDAGR